MNSAAASRQNPKNQEVLLVFCNESLMKCELYIF